MADRIHARCVYLLLDVPGLGGAADIVPTPRSSGSRTIRRAIPPAPSIRRSRPPKPGGSCGHYTPKHVSWLNMVRSKSACCEARCLDRRIDDPKRLCLEITVWERQRNAVRVTAASACSTKSQMASATARWIPSIAVGNGHIAASHGNTCGINRNQVWRALGLLARVRRRVRATGVCKAGTCGVRVHAVAVLGVALIPSHQSRYFRPLPRAAALF